MGCSNPANDRDAQMLEEAAQGVFSGIDPSLVDATVAKVVDQAHQTPGDTRGFHLRYPSCLSL